MRLLGNGELKAKLDLVVAWSATASAAKAVEAAGGKLTLTRPAPANDEA